MSILIIMVVLTALYLFGEWWYDNKRRYPHKWTCSYCKSVGTTVTFKSNSYGLTRRFQLDHLESKHNGAL